MGSLGAAAMSALMIFVLTLVLFQFTDKSWFKMALWLGMPLAAYCITVAINFASQFSICGKINAGNAFLGGLPTIGTMLAGIGISSISFCRIPILSVFGSYFVGKQVGVTQNASTATLNSVKNASKPCCTPQLTLETIENAYPMASGLSYGFYLFFSMMFGVVIGSGVSAVC